MKKSALKEALMKRKMAPIVVDEEEDMVGSFKGEDVDSILGKMAGDKPMQETDVQQMKEDMLNSRKSEQEEGTGDKAPLTLKVDDGADTDLEAENDLAPGVPSDPQDHKADADMAREELIEAIMGGYTEDEMKARGSGSTLKGKLRQHALKMR